MNVECRDIFPAVTESSLESTVAAVNPACTAATLPHGEGHKLSIQDVASVTLNEETPKWEVNLETQRDGDNNLHRNTRHFQIVLTFPANTMSNGGV